MTHTADDAWTPGFRRGFTSFCAALLAASAACALAAPAPAAVPAAAAPPSRALVVLLHDHVARSSPWPTAPRLETVAGRRPLTGVRTVLPVFAHATSSDGTQWVHVELPGRPNMHEGWITTDRTRATSTGWRITVKLRARLVTVYRFGDVVRRFRAVVGKPSTPTPQGRFFIEEAMSLGSQQAGGPYALASSARSKVLQDFDGGPGQIALHGMDNLPGALGTAASHGCIRLSTPAITWLASRIGAGVPLTIEA